MFDVGVDAAVAEEAEQMELAGAAAFHGFEEQRLALEFAAGDELVNAGDIHVHDAAGADVEMADFAIAHLSFGEADGGAGGVDERVGKFFEEAIVIWFAREGDGVAGGFGAIAPAVEDGEDNGFWAFVLGGHVAFRYGRNAWRPGKRALAPRASSMRRSWLYLAMRSVREAEPVLIWPVPMATTKSARKVSSVSPLRWETMAA